MYVASKTPNKQQLKQWKWIKYKANTTNKRKETRLLCIWDGTSEASVKNIKIKKIITGCYILCKCKTLKFEKKTILCMVSFFIIGEAFDIGSADQFWTDHTETEICFAGICPCSAIAGFLQCQTHFERQEFTYIL